MKLGIVGDYHINGSVLLSDELSMFTKYLQQNHDDEIHVILYNTDTIGEDSVDTLNLRTAELESSSLDFDSVYFGLAGKPITAINKNNGISDDFEEFIKYAQDFEKKSPRKTQFINAASTIQDNLSKAYLLDFSETPHIQTYQVNSLDDLLYMQRTQDNMILKPLVAERAQGIYSLDKLSPEDLGQISLQYLGNKRFDQGLIAQPFSPFFEQYGERKVAIVDGEITLSRNHPGSASSQKYKDITSIQISPQEREIALLAYEEIGKRSPRYFGRVDMTGPRDAPVVNEVELVNPSFATRTGIYSDKQLQNHFDALYEVLK